MTFFESLLVLLLCAIGLLQFSRRLSLPYPPMLAAAGVVVAFIPGSPVIHIDPETALAIFIAPALLDAAFDFPRGNLKKFWKPLVILAVLAVLATTGIVAWLGVSLAGLPWAAAIALGAIVAPPDAAAAVAVLASVAVPRNTATILKGESLLNDATSLLLFSGALAVQEGGVTGGVGVRLLLAAPLGALLGYVLARVTIRIQPYVTGTLGGNVLQFVSVCLVWIIASRLDLSAVLCMVAFAMTLASSPSLGNGPRMRVHSYAVWATVVFLLNVLAFLLMGMQVRVILGRMESAGILESLTFVGWILLAVILVRFIVVMSANRLAFSFKSFRIDSEPPLMRQGVLVAWSGMRGLLTLATAFALPESFPRRDLITLTAFGVVLGTLVLQGATLKPLIRYLRLDRTNEVATELMLARKELIETGMAMLVAEEGPEAENLRYLYRIEESDEESPNWSSPRRYRELGLATVREERRRLREMFARDAVSAEIFNLLQEELDWRELALLPDEARRIEQN